MSIQASAPVSSSQRGEDYRKAGNEDSNGGESGNVTDEISHWSLLTRYVPTLFSFRSIVNRVLLMFSLPTWQNRFRFPLPKPQAADSKAKNPEEKILRVQKMKLGKIPARSSQTASLRQGCIRSLASPTVRGRWMAGQARSDQKSTILPSASVTRRSIRPASSWLCVAISAARPDWRTSASSASKT